MNRLADLLLVALCIWALVLAMGALADLVARVSRYRAYRRRYPSAERGLVWRHVR